MYSTPSFLALPFFLTLHSCRWTKVIRMKCSTTLGQERCVYCVATDLGVYVL